MRRMSLRLAPLFACVLIVVLGLGACASREGNHWRGVRHGEVFAVVFSPVETTPIDAIWPEASRQFAYDLANRVDVMGRDADGWAAEDAPKSSAQTTIAAAAGADWTVNTRLISLDLGPSPFGPQWVAKVEMRVVDATGHEVFRKIAHGTNLAETSVKMVAIQFRPEVKAAWAACGEAVSALIERLKLRNEAALPSEAVTPPPSVPPVAITVTSVPDHADVLIDGKFRGTTPLALTLAQTPIEVRIERQGRTPWIRTLTPVEGMQIAPALEEVPAPAGSQPAPASVPAPAPAPAAAP